MTAATGTMRNPRGHTQLRHRRRAERGVSILEVLIAFIVLQAGMLVAIHALLIGTRFSAQARNRTVASLAAQAQMETVVREELTALTAGGALTEERRIPEEPASVPAPPAAAGTTSDDLRWQATIRPTDTAGLYEVAVTVSYPGWNRRDALTVTTRAVGGGA